MMDRQAFCLHPSLNHVLTYSLNLKKEVLLFIFVSIDSTFFGQIAVRISLPNLVVLSALKIISNGVILVLILGLKMFFINFGLILFIVLNISIARVLKRLPSIEDWPLFSNNAP